MRVRKALEISDPGTRIYIARVSNPTGAEDAVRSHLNLGDDYAVEADMLRSAPESDFEARQMGGGDVQEVIL
jgi:hypothetical protein